MLRRPRVSLHQIRRARTPLIRGARANSPQHSLPQPSPPPSPEPGAAPADPRGKGGLRCVAARWAASAAARYEGDGAALLTRVCALSPPQRSPAPRGAPHARWCVGMTCIPRRGEGLLGVMHSARRRAAPQLRERACCLPDARGCSCCSPPRRAPRTRTGSRRGMDGRRQWGWTSI